MPEFQLDPGTVVPVISDTHGLLRPEVLPYLEGAPVILHAGDVDRETILDQIQQIAPTVCVRGNVDRGDFGDHLPLTEVVDLSGHLVYMQHILQDIAIDPAAAGLELVISGHSHKPGIDEKDGVTYLNPGSAGPRRFTLPVSIATLTLTTDALVPELITLDV